MRYYYPSPVIHYASLSSPFLMSTILLSPGLFMCMRFHFAYWASGGGYSTIHSIRMQWSNFGAESAKARVHLLYSLRLWWMAVSNGEVIEKSYKYSVSKTIDLKFEKNRGEINIFRKSTVTNDYHGSLESFLLISCFMFTHVTVTPSRKATP